MKHSFPIYVLNLETPFISDEECRFWSKPSDLLNHLSENPQPKVLLLNLDQIENPIDYLDQLSEKNPDSIWMIKPSRNLEKSEAKTFPQFYGFLAQENEADRRLVEASLERVSEINQENDLLHLLESENLKLKNSLEKISNSGKKDRSPSQSVSKAHLRMKTLEGSLLEILKARSVVEIEKALKKSLSKLLSLEYVRIFFNQQSSLVDQQQDGSHIIKIPLIIAESRSKGWLVLCLSKRKTLQEKDMDLLEEIAEITSLSVNRILQLEASESLKQQWDATFDAISDPLCLVDEKMSILRTNKAFSKTVGKSFGQLLGKDSLKTFFKDNPEVWQSPPPFNLKIQIQSKKDGKYYNLVVHDLKFTINHRNVNLLLIKEITDQMRLEKQIREKSKLVELGTIGSSIAHELNNPLAGMLSYLQLLLMDAEKGSEFFDDLKEMEAATLRCKDIVQNLLGFSRKQTLTQRIELDLNDLITKAVQLVELKSRFKKVHIEIKSKVESAPFKGDQNSLVQALTHILTNSVEALEESLATREGFTAQIEITLEIEKAAYRISIIDNGPGILERHLPLVINPLFTTKTGTNHAGLGLTVAYSIFSEHEGSLEIESRPGQGVTAIISLPRPEIQRSSRGIDTEI